MADAARNIDSTDHEIVLVPGHPRAFEIGRDQWVIYGLRSGTKVIRSVGYSTRPYERLLQHRGAARRGGIAPMHKWVRSIFARGDDVSMVILQIGSDPIDAEEAERSWIDRLRSNRLFNVRLGGDLEPYISPESRASASTKLKARVFTDEHRRRISEAKKGCKRPDAAARLREVSKANIGKKMNLSDAERARRAASARAVSKNLARWNDLTDEQKVERAAKIAASVAKSWADLTPDQRKKRCGPLVESRKERLNSAS